MSHSDEKKVGFVLVVHDISFERQFNVDCLEKLISHKTIFPIFETKDWPHILNRNVKLISQAQKNEITRQ